MKLTTQQLEQLKQRNLKPEQIEQQYYRLLEGFPKIELHAAADLGFGIIKHSDEKIKQFAEAYIAQKHHLNIKKFVPASGAATRMFKFLHKFLREYRPHNESINAYINKHKAQNLFTFFVGIEKMPFYKTLHKQLQKCYPYFNDYSLSEQRWFMVKTLLEKPGLDFSSFPKGLIPFHLYGNKQVSAFEEQLYESMAYASANEKLQLIFSIHEDHLKYFEKELKKVSKSFKNTHSIDLEVQFTFQRKETDTISITHTNELLVDEAGALIFRPSGHGALLPNLAEIDADILFLKNIDNVAISDINQENALYKNYLAGLLLQVQSQSFEYISLLENERPESADLNAIKSFVQNTLNASLPKNYDKFSDPYKIAALKEKLHRPIRVCGMVKNEGEPGGGPFWVKDTNGTISLQIIEDVQINKDSKEQKKIHQRLKYFNPVDIVCGLKDYRGNRFPLMEFCDAETGIITEKNHKGIDIKALEKPGLWNGAMAHWNSVFVEVPLSTFNPVKTVNDLLKPAHQA